MRIEAKDVDDYLDKVPEKRQAGLRQLRELIESTADDLVINLEYGMPTYWVGAHSLCAFASQKNYMSLYMNMNLVEKYRDEFGSLNCGKSCIRFTRIERLPFDTVAKILRETYAEQKALAQASAETS